MTHLQQDPEPVIGRLELLARQAAPGARPSHLCEAVAAALGFSTHAALLAAFRARKLDPELDFCPRDFERKLIDLGYGGDFEDLGALARQSEAVVLPLLPPGRRRLPDGSVILDGSFDLLDHIENRLKRRQEHAIAVLAARGLPPAERSTIFSPYLEPLNYGFRWLADASDQIEIRIETRNHDYANRRHSTGGERPIWGRHWPDYGVTVSANDLLAFLARAWPILASNFLKKPAVRDAVVDFRAGIGRPDLPRFEIAVRGPEFEVLAERGRCRPGSEGLMVAEGLMTLGDELASGLAGRGLSHSTVAAWTAARELDDLPPTEAESGDFTTPGAECIRAGAAYFARKLGLPLEVYTDVALFEIAAHNLWHEHGMHGVEPRGGDGFRAVLLGTLPPSAEIRRMAEEARMLATNLEPRDPDEWVLNALHQANMDARAMTFYHGWPDRLPPMPVMPDVDPESLVGKRVRNRRSGDEYVVVAVGGTSAVGEPMLRLRGAKHWEWQAQEADFDWRLSDVVTMEASDG